MNEGASKREAEAHGTLRRIVGCAGGLDRWAARAYVAGPALTDAVHVCHRLSRSGVGATICLWNDGTTERRRGRWPIATTAALRTVAEERLDVRVALKAPALAYDPGFADELAVLAERTGMALHFDSLAWDTAERTLAREALRRLKKPGQGELELLFGLPMRGAMRIARRGRVQARVYVGYGRARLPYFLAHARRSPLLALRLARDALLGRSFRIVE